MIARLLWFAENEFRLGKQQKGGGTLRDHLLAFERMTGKRHPDNVSDCPLPECLRHIWVYFWDLNAGRPVWQGGFRPLPATEIYAWEQINEIKLDPWELGAIRQLDALFLKTMTQE